MKIYSASFAQCKMEKLEITNIANKVQDSDEKFGTE